MIAGVLPQQLRESEVGDLHSAAFVDEDVFRLNVPMHDPFVVSELQRRANLWHNRQRFRRRHVAGLDRLP